MDADEFLRSGVVAQTGSRLDAFKGDIQKLLEAGCKQVVVLQFLEQNGVSISKAYLSKYVRSRPELAKHWKQKIPTTEVKEIKAAAKRNTKSEDVPANEVPIVARIPDTNTETSDDGVSENELQEDVRSQDDKGLDKYMKVNSLRSRFEKT